MLYVVVKIWKPMLHNIVFIIWNTDKGMFNKVKYMNATKHQVDQHVNLVQPFRVELEFKAMCVL